MGQIDSQRRRFELRTQQGIYTIILPENPGAGMMEYFNRLQTGATVSVEGTPFGADGLTLRRFV